MESRPWVSAFSDPVSMLSPSESWLPLKLLAKPGDKEEEVRERKEHEEVFIKPSCIELTPDIKQVGWRGGWGLRL